MDLATAEEQNANIVDELGCSSLATPGKVVQCMRNKTTEEIQKVVPKIWDTVKKIWAFPPEEAASNPKGLDLPGKLGTWRVAHVCRLSQITALHICKCAGVAIVDGKVVTKPLIQALKEGMVDVPFILGSLAQEPDAQPGRILWDSPVKDFQELVNQTFRPWGTGTGSKILDIYASDLKSGGPQKAYDSILADYGANCANIDVAKTAAQGFSSPVYSYVITQCPVKPVWNFDPKYQNRFSFHSFDVLAGLKAYGLFAFTLGLPVYTPHECDLQFGDIIRAGWVQLAYNGRLDSKSPGGWRAVNDVPGFPSNYNVGIIGTTVNGCDRSPSEAVATKCDAKSQTQTNFKDDICTWWNSKGFDQRFWWSN
eukprot:gb/GECG01008391.1/.p1 GENE.gb/GECG01008391.1/~~gb/GECG01008391.1/.p1  ORF type:complete len:367 (+),score=24.85 gb/GECG01008391.1/:1-1101(+)